MDYKNKKVQGISTVLLLTISGLMLFQNCSQFESISHKTELFNSELEVNTLEPDEEPEAIAPPIVMNPPMEPEVMPPTMPVVEQPMPEEMQTGKVPTKPLNLKIGIVSNSGLELDWESSTDEDGEVVGYKIYRNDKLLDEVLKKDVSKNDIRKRYFLTTTYYDCNNMDLQSCGAQAPKIGTAYNYQVQAVDNAGNVSEKSDVFTASLYPLTPQAVIHNIKNNSNYELVLNEEFSNVTYEGLKNNWEFRRIWDKQGAYNSNPEVKQLYVNNKSHQQIINGEHGYMVDLSNSEQTTKVNPFQPSLGGQALKIEAKPSPENLFTTAFTRKWSNEQNKEVLGEVKKLNYSTGLLRSKMSFTSGFFEARMKLAGHHGMLSTFYLLHKTYSVPEGQNYGASEIDIMEYLGGSKSLYGKPDRGRFVYQNYHYKSRLAPYQPVHKAPGQYYVRSDNAHFSNDFHNYAVYWEEGLVIWYIDDIEIHRMTGPAITTDPKELIISLVVGGEWGGPPDPGTVSALEIDYVKVYQKKNQTTVTPKNSTSGTIKVSNQRFTRHGKNGELFWSNPEDLKRVSVHCEVDGKAFDKIFELGEKSFYIEDLGSDREGFCEIQAIGKDNTSGGKLKVIIPAKK